MTLHYSLALQGITPNFNHRLMAVQGEWSREGVVVEINNLLFAPYLILSLANAVAVQSEISEVYALTDVRSDRVKAFDIPLVKFTILKPKTTMADFYIKKGDTLPKLESTLKYSTGKAVDLTGATQVQLVYKLVKGTTAIARTATIVTAAEGKVSYQWQSADTVESGDYLAEWRITFSGGGQLTIPNDESFISFRISERLT